MLYRQYLNKSALSLPLFRFSTIHFRSFSTRKHELPSWSGTYLAHSQVGSHRRLWRRPSAQCLLWPSAQPPPLRASRSPGSCRSRERGGPPRQSGRRPQRRCSQSPVEKVGKVQSTSWIFEVIISLTAGVGMLYAEMRRKAKLFFRQDVLIEGFSLLLAS